MGNNFSSAIDITRSRSIPLRISSGYRLILHDTARTHKTRTANLLGRAQSVYRPLRILKLKRSIRSGRSGTSRPCKMVEYIVSVPWQSFFQCSQFRQFTRDTGNTLICRDIVAVTISYQCINTIVMGQQFSNHCAAYKSIGSGYNSCHHFMPPAFKYTSICWSISAGMPPPLSHTRVHSTVFSMASSICQCGFQPKVAFVGAIQFQEIRLMRSIRLCLINPGKVVTPGLTESFHQLSGCHTVALIRSNVVPHPAKRLSSYCR